MAISVVYALVSSWLC